MKVLQRLLRRPFFIKLLNWEYWSFGMVYTWIYPVWFYYCLRARSFFFFSASNPSIKNGGFLNESKKDIHAIMPPHLYPPTIHFDVGSEAKDVVDTLQQRGFSYPLVGKPDIGGRGRGVKVLDSDAAVAEYVKMSAVDFHVQQFVPYPKEAGIFYYRYPGEARGRISGIVCKEFLSVKGDGVSTIRMLIMSDNRSLLQIEALENIYGSELDTVLKKDVIKVMVPYGNHARGAKFLDDSHLNDAQLTAVIDDVCRQVKDFYFGRLDIRYNTWEELRRGENFCVIEVNGAGSEPTHIYDPRHSLFFAWKEIIRHWKILWEISTINHRNGHPYLNIKEGIAMFQEDRLHSEKLATMPE